MRTFASLEIRFEYVLVGKLPNRRIIRRKILSCDSGISDCIAFPKGAFTNPPAPVQVSKPATWILDIVRVPFDFHSYGVYDHIAYGAR